MEPKPLRKSTGARRALAAAALAGAVAASGIAWLLADEAPSSTAEVPEPSPAVQQTAFAPLPVAAQPPAQAALRPESTGEMQICGGSWVKLGADGTPETGDLATILDRSTQEVAARTIDVMKAAGSPRAQAAARYLQLGRADLAFLPASRCETALCQRDREALKAEADVERDALARLAQDSNDPQIYAWAYRGCLSIAGKHQGGACASLSAGQWTYLDPLLADAWLAAAAEARLRNDVAGVEDAMFHVAHADRVDLGSAALAAEVLNHVPTDDATLPGLAGLLVQAATTAVSRMRGLPATLEHCSEKELFDANRRETCERIATVMAERSTTSYGVYLAGELGTRLGWPADRLDALQRELDAGQAAVQRHSRRAATDPQACATFRFEVERVRDIVRWGEPEANRRLVAATGRAPAELAAETRRLRAGSEKKAAGEDAAASGPARAAASATSLAAR